LAERGGDGIKRSKSAHTTTCPQKQTRGKPMSPNTSQNAGETGQFLIFSST